MSRRIGSVMLAAFIAALTACGTPAAVFLRIEAPLVVPEQADAVSITFDRGEGSEVLSEETFELDEGHAFPVTLTMETRRDDLIGEPLRVRATVLKEGMHAAPWSRGEVEVVLKPRELTPATVTLCDCAR